MPKFRLTFAVFGEGGEPYTSQYIDIEAHSYEFKNPKRVRFSNENGGLVADYRDGSIYDVTELKGG